MALPLAALAFQAQLALAPGALVAASRLTGSLGALLTHQVRSCSYGALRGDRQASGAGNVYPPLSEVQAAALRRRRVQTAAAPARRPAACEPGAAADTVFASPYAGSHQTKHIMLCTGGSACKATSAACATGQRTWEYLQQRLQEINQLRAAADNEQPILGTRVDCVNAAKLLPPLAAAQRCRGPVAVVLPEGVVYERLSPLVIERIIEEHLFGGHVVESHVMLGSRTPAAPRGGAVLPALDISRRATPTNTFACDYATYG
ncbi:hypothetical protein HT031_000221 [Scenedesmus sp. PABB004]|nr:hypothetical protein HT031_000221 [Scenedesmus sp. PABB004]